MKPLLDAVLLDIGGTLVHQAAPGTPVEDLEVQLRPSAVDDLAWMAESVLLGAVTDTAIMDEPQVRGLLEPSGLADLLPVIVTSIDVGRSKPDPLSIITAMERLGVEDASRVLFIGDRPEDEEAAERAGVLYVPIAGLTGDRDQTIRQVVQSWLERTAGHRFEEARARIGKSNIETANAAAALQGQLTKPPGSLGRLESISIQLAGIAGACPPPVPAPACVAVFAADHGIAEWSVSPWPQEVTAQMVANFDAGGAAVNVLARQNDADVVVVDVGVAHPIPITGGAGSKVVHRKVRAGTSNLAVGPAMSRIEALLGLDVGVEIAENAVAAGAACLITGEMGIANTTSATAIIAAVTNSTPEEITGRGSGADDEMLARKIAVIEAAITDLTTTAGPLTVLEQIGGFEIAAMAGLIVGGAAARVPVIIDGVIADAAALIAAQLAPDIVDYVIAGHRSTEPAAEAALAFLNLEPVLDLDLRLGEGTGAVLAHSVVQAAALTLREMATFDGAGVSREKD